MVISLIVAMGKNRVIGKDSRIPWHLPADLKQFKTLTMGHPVIMGRKTFESIGKPLPGRTNIVLSKTLHVAPEGCVLVRTFAGAIDAARASRGSDEVFVIGGSAVYTEALPIVDKLYFTIVHHEFEGDSFFPEVDMADWREAERRSLGIDENNPYDCSFFIYDRIKK
ncbi:MAG: dihydrofolate reductase [Parcubacteria group bacterium RIFCSPLOWO2_01_FULL_48_18]|nr:MAG: dihydrofolate reductase [Parcubacteria group bacterium RIFCSPHIGHO2_02_FULL_48_10b]OHB22049.1 MAG: dihydrofolate reductase [Parcubacteria group bacterium RIFCSPLOWO2_01_FULL_48_18]